MPRSEFPTSAAEFQERIDAASTGGATPGDQSRTWDGRVLDSKETALDFIADLEEAHRTGQVLGPPLDD